MSDYAQAGWDEALIRAARSGTLMSLLDWLGDGGNKSEILMRYHNLAAQWKIEDDERRQSHDGQRGKGA